jgi:hypothetical protein
MQPKDGEALGKLLCQTILVTSTMRSSLFAHTLIVKQ